MPWPGSADHSAPGHGIHPRLAPSRGRPTLVAGGAGSGKTLLALEFVIKGATLYNEPGVFVAFEETAPELVTNVQSLGLDIPGLVKRKSSSSITSTSNAPR